MLWFFFNIRRRRTRVDRVGDSDDPRPKARRAGRHCWPTDAASSLFHETPSPGASPRIGARRERRGKCRERALGSYVVGGVPIYALIPVGRYSREASPSFLVREGKTRNGLEVAGFQANKTAVGRGGEQRTCYTKLYGI